MGLQGVEQGKSSRERNGLLSSWPDPDLGGLSSISSRLGASKNGAIRSNTYAFFVPLNSEVCNATFFPFLGASKNGAIHSSTTG